MSDTQERESLELEPEGDQAPEAVRTRSEDALKALDESEYSDEEFEEMMGLYEDTLQNIKEGEIVNGTVLAIDENGVVVDIGFKSEGSIPVSEFTDPSEIEVGQEIEVYLETVEDNEGQIVLSKQKADFMRVWDRIKEAYDNDQIIEGRLVRRIKGGIVVDLFGVDAFLPGSQIDIKQVKNFDQFINEVFPFRIIKLNKARRNIVVSRRVVLEEERARLRKQILETLEVGQIREGVVKNITDFGAFIDLGGLDGLLHITDISWGRVGHPSEALGIGDQLQVKVLNYDEERERISLGMKQLTPHPWEEIDEKYVVDTRVMGRVVSITDYGAFVELERGVEGLVHISEMSWTQHIRHPSKILTIDDEVEVLILNVDKEGQKISLGLKQVTPDPWLTLDEKYPPGKRMNGRVRNLVNFGAFVEIEEGIDGLVHISDMSWTKRIRHPSEIVQKADEVEVVVLSVDKSRRRISLGLKQTLENPWAELAVRYAVGQQTHGKITRLLERGVVVDLEGDVEGFVPVSQVGIPDLKHPQSHFSEGDDLPMKVVEFDEEQRKIVLSVREYLRDAEQAEVNEYIESHKARPVTVQEFVAEDAEGDAWGGVGTSAPDAGTGGDVAEEGTTEVEVAVGDEADQESDVVSAEPSAEDAGDTEGPQAADESASDVFAEEGSAGVDVAVGDEADQASDAVSDETSAGPEALAPAVSDEVAVGDEADQASDAVSDETSAGPEALAPTVSDEVAVGGTEEVAESSETSEPDAAEEEFKSDDEGEENGPAAEREDEPQA